MSRVWPLRALRAAVKGSRRWRSLRACCPWRKTPRSRGAWRCSPRLTATRLGAVAMAVAVRSSYIQSCRGRGIEPSAAPPDYSGLGWEIHGPGGRNLAGRAAPTDRDQVLLLAARPHVFASSPTPSTRHLSSAISLFEGVGTTHHITHKLPRHVDLAPDRARRVEDRSVAPRQTTSIPIVAAADDGRHGNVPSGAFA